MIIIIFGTIMGKKKLCKTEAIEDRNSHKVVYSKRKRNLLKQCIELSKMCS
jgi:hypothetical protein